MISRSDFSFEAKQQQHKQLMEYTDNSNIPDSHNNDLNSKNSITSDSTDSNSDDTGGIDGSNSSSPSEYEEEGFFVQNYTTNPEWKDISAVKPDPYEAKVLGIPYVTKFREAHEYFRAIFKKNELSERALKLTEDCISWNPANSTVWVFRRKCLLALGKNLVDELNYLNDIIVDHSKNYQVWQHRRWIIELLADPKTEKDFTDKLFKQDGKNYHAWQYRQWVISHFKWWDGELEYTEELLTEDLRNNSAWNHRYVVLKRTKQLQNNEIIENEVAFSIEKILKVPENESPWNYLRGILAGVGLNKFPEKTKVFENITSLHCFSFRIDAMEELLRDQNTKDQTTVQKILDLVEKLANKMDVIRSQYWLFIGRNISEKYETKKDTMID